jgi:thioredoxin
MKKWLLVLGILIIVLGIYFLFFQGQSSNPDTNIKVNNNITAAIAEAKSNNKNVLIDFYATWCHYCQLLDKETFSDPRVQQRLNTSFVAVKIDIDKNPDAAYNFKVYGVPTLIILNINGQVIKRIDGYITADEFLNQI